MSNYISVQITDTNKQVSSDAGGSGVAIALGVLFGISTIVAIILAVLAWRYWRRYTSFGGHKAESYVQSRYFSFAVDKYWKFLTFWVHFLCTFLITES